MGKIVDYLTIPFLERRSIANASSNVVLVCSSPRRLSVKSVSTLRVSENRLASLVALHCSGSLYLFQHLNFELGWRM